MPVRDHLAVAGCVAGRGARRVDQLDEAVAGLGDEAIADQLAHRDQIVCRAATRTLVHREEHLRVVQRGNSLGRDEVRITGPDSDDMDATHRRRLTEPKPGTPSIRYPGY